MSDIIKVQAAAETRTPEQAARATPVSLPAGSYEFSDLQKDLDEAAKARNDDKRDDMVAEAVAKHNQIATDLNAVPAGTKQVHVVDEIAGVAEIRTVFDPAVAEANASPEQATPAPAPAKQGE